MSLRRTAKKQRKGVTGRFAGVGSLSNSCAVAGLLPFTRARIAVFVSVGEYVMATLLIFYGLLTVFVAAGAVYSLYLHRKYMHK